MSSEGLFSVMGPNGGQIIPVHRTKIVNIHCDLDLVRGHCCGGRMTAENFDKRGEIGRYESNIRSTGQSECHPSYLNGVY